MVWTDGDLLATVKRLAAPAEAQVAWLKELGTYPSLDELALEFDDEFARVRSGQADHLSPDALGALFELDQELDRISGAANARLWDPESLDGPEWRAIRELAARAAAAMVRR